jgi:hypothetical protein
MAPASWHGKLRHFSAYARPEAHLTQQTGYGAAITVRALRSGGAAPHTPPAFPKPGFTAGRPRRCMIRACLS